MPAGCRRTSTCAVAQRHRRGHRQPDQLGRVSAEVRRERGAGPGRTLLRRQQPEQRSNNLFRFRNMDRNGNNQIERERMERQRSSRSTPTTGTATACCRTARCGWARAAGRRRGRLLPQRPGDLDAAVVPPNRPQQRRPDRAQRVVLRAGVLPPRRPRPQRRADCGRVRQQRDVGRRPRRSLRRTST